MSLSAFDQRASIAGRVEGPLFHVNFRGFGRGGHSYLSRLRIQNINLLHRLTSLEWLELVYLDDGVSSLNFMAGLAKLRTLLLPFHRLQLHNHGVGDSVLGGLSCCQQLTRLDLGHNSDAFLNSEDVCNALREQCFCRQPMPIRDIRLRGSWVDLTEVC